MVNIFNRVPNLGPHVCAAVSVSNRLSFSSIANIGIVSKVGIYAIFKFQF